MSSPGNKKKGVVILGIGAHPDDLEASFGGTAAKFIKDGAVCYYLICTDGSKGSDDPKITEGKLIKIRRDEQIRAAKVLGVKKVYFLNHKDTELLPDLKLKKEIVRYIRLLKPDIVVTMDPTVVYSKNHGFVNHTDHRAVGLAAIDAVYPMSRDRLTFKELEKEGLKVHKVSTMYLINFDTFNESIDITSTMDLKQKALSLHKSQISKRGLEFLKKVAHERGKEAGFKYAECFVRLEFN